MCTDESRLFVVHEGQINKPAIQGDVGFDVVAAEAVRIERFGRAKVNLGLKIQMPANVWCRLVCRSKFVAQGLVVLDSVIDEGYTGPLFAFVVNLGDDPIEIGSGERVAQVVFFPAVVPALVAGKVGQTLRGANGFGSTGR